VIADLPTFTLIHVVISVLGIIAGLIVQLFAKTPTLQELAPTQSEAPFALTQALAPALFAWIGRAAVRGFAAGAVRASERARSVIRADPHCRSASQVDGPADGDATFLHLRQPIGGKRLGQLFSNT
jgi:hypothetical protein